MTCPPLFGSFIKLWQSFASEILFEGEFLFLQRTINRFVWNKLFFINWLMHFIVDLILRFEILLLDFVYHGTKKKYFPPQEIVFNNLLFFLRELYPILFESLNMTFNFLNYWLLIFLKFINLAFFWWVLMLLISVLFLPNMIIVNGDLLKWSSFWFHTEFIYFP